MILVIDNYDSFTYNLVQLMGELGADLKVVRNDQATLDEELAAAMGELISDRVAAILGSRPNVIIPLPMFWLRRKPPWVSRSFISPAFSPTRWVKTLRSCWPSR